MNCCCSNEMSKLNPDHNGVNATEVRAVISGLFQQLENPSPYNADQFASSLRRIRTLLHDSGRLAVQ